MRAVGADRELELEQQLVCRGTVRIIDMAILAAHLAEFARPVGQDRRPATIEQRRIRRTIRTIVASAQPPAPRELVVAGDVVAHAPLASVELLPIAPDD